MPTEAPLAAVNPRFNVLHRENDSCAFAVPAPTVMLKERVGFFGFSEPLDVCVCTAGGEGGGEGAEATTAVGADAAVADPAVFEAVTAATSVDPTSAV